MHTPDLTEENIKKLAVIFPSCVTETKDEITGELKRAIDFDQLRQELSGHIVEGPRERYHLDWPGKREALIAANAPIAKTLRPCREESVNFDTTKNLFIEGDNLDALKLLQETYLGKVKMIYIDPPYNTGNDFVYDDDFSEDIATYLLRTNQRDDLGNRYVENNESNGRFHSDWLSMLYSRLRIASRLLSDDGFIVISISDAELANTRKLCDEVFGSPNFVAQFLWRKKTTTSNVKDAQVSPQVDYQICYRRTPAASIKQRVRSVEDRSHHFSDKEGNYRTTVIEKKDSGTYRRDTMKFKIIGREPRSGKRWQIGEKTARALEAKNRFLFDGEKVVLKIYDFEDGDTFSAQPNVLEGVGTSDSAAKMVNDEIFGHSELFDNPKPVELVRHLIRIAADHDSIIMDFFSGSSTTAHSVILQNLEDGGTRRHISMQIAEPTGDNSVAKAAGFETIADVSKERIRRSGAKLKAENAITYPSLDIGFRVLKVDTSNMADVYYAPDAVKQADLVAHTDNIKADRTSEDLLFQVLVDWGVDLSLPITEEKMAGKTVFFVDGNALAACFDSMVSEDLVKELAKRKPLRAVFRDSSFDSDSTKINVEQIFKLLSPETEVKTL